MATRQSNSDTAATEKTVQTANSGGGFLRDNVRTLGFIGFGLLVLVGVVFFFVFGQGKENDRALVELARIRPYYEKGEFAIAINGDSSKTINGEKVRGLRQIVDEHKGTPAGKIAALLLGNSYLGVAQPAQAKGPFDIATGAEDHLVTSAAHAGLASVAEAANRFDEAASEFAKAASEDRLELNTPQYLLNAARNYERAGKKDEAIEQYKTVATRFPQAQANAQAQLALARLGVEV